MPRCNFCINRDPRDRLAYTHMLRKPTGELECPFLKVIRCSYCLECGHTEAYCPASLPSHQQSSLDDLIQRVAQVQLTPRHRPDPNDFNPGGARIFCKFCYHYNPNDPFCTTHHTHDPRTGELICPRILLTQCAYCRQYGHTTRHCETKKKAELPPPGPDDPNLIIDFSSDEDMSEE